MNHERKEPTTLFAVVSFLVIIAVLIIMINMGCNTTLSVFAGVIVSVITTRLLNIPLSEVEQNIIKTAAECMPTFLIVIMVGMLVGIWMAGGTVPTLLYYGMQVVSPKILVPSELRNILSFDSSSKIYRIEDAMPKDLSCIFSAIVLTYAISNFFPFFAIL